MGDSLDYDATLRVLRTALGRVAGNVRAFGMRARGRPQLLGPRSWAELSEIEAVLGSRLQDVIRTQLKAEPWTAGVRLISTWQGLRGGLFGSEAGIVARGLQSACELPVSRWRGGAPQLEEQLWPLFEARTQYLANTFALARDEPAPFPILVWSPSSQAFRR